MFENEILVFWLIHLFLGVIGPAMIYVSYRGLRANAQPQPVEIVIRHDRP